MSWFINTKHFIGGDLGYFDTGYLNFLLSVEDIFLSY